MRWHTKEPILPVSHEEWRFVFENAERESKRRKLLAMLTINEPIWRDEDHPDIAEVGAAAWVHSMRREQSARQEDLEKLSDNPKDFEIPEIELFPGN
jgi:uncharacterized membrane-anchored protein